MPVARAPAALQLAPAGRLALLLVIARLFSTRVMTSTVVTVLWMSIAGEPIMQSIADSVSWQSDFLEIRSWNRGIATPICRN
jgi:hypothetical protein